MSSLPHSRCIPAAWTATVHSLRRRRVLIGVTVVAALLVGACGDDDGGSTPTGGDLEGRTFVATDIEGYDVVEGSQVVISFEDGTIVVQAGCNTQQTAYAVSDEGVLETGEMLTTMMACDDALMAQDQVIAEIITSGPTMALDGDELTVVGADVTITLAAQG